MSDVLIGQAYFLRFDPKLWDAQQPYAPLGALYAAAVVRDRGYDVALFDAMLAQSEAQWADALDRHRPAIAVLYEDSFNYLTKMCLLRMRQAALAMIDEAAARGVAVIVSGSDATDHPATYLSRGARAVIRGEGERTLPDVLDVLMGQTPRRLHDVPGVCFQDEAGRLTETAPRETIRDLDSLPRPAWDLIDVDRYRTVWRRRHGYFSMNVSTTRGCPYHCNWCAKPIYGQRYAARSPESVAEEIAWLKATYAPDHLWIVDDIFGLKPGWIERFGELVAKNGAAVPFKCLLRADQVTPAAAASLRAAGCRTAWMGAESGAQRVLDAMEKGIRVEQIAAATRWLRAEGIEVCFFLQFGYPGETRADIDLTLQMVRDCRPDDLGVSVSYPLPGTPFFDRVKSQLGVKQNWVDSDDLEIMYRATYEPAFYRTLHSLVHAEFRCRRAAARLGELVRRPANIRWRHARTLASCLRHAGMSRVLRRRLNGLGRVPAAGVTPTPIAVLTPAAAAVPSDQAR